MLQLLQHLGNGSTSLVDVPAPGASRGRLLIRTSRSLVSAGTERMLLDFGKAGLLGKARQQPEKVRAVLNKVRADGVLATWRAVRSKLDQPIPLGYCNVGRVVAVGDAEKAEMDFAVGGRVVSNSPHAEVVSAPQLLCAKVPDAVDDESATFTPLAAIALEGIDLLHVKAGDRIVVTGLGLIGQLAVQLLRALGCGVLGFDPAPERRALAARFGAELPLEGEDPVKAALRWSEGQGVAGVLITASTASNELVNQAARSCRFRGRVVLVGVVGLQLNRADFYRNEVSFQVSCSYGRRDHAGPGSTQDNFKRVLQFMARGELVVRELITHRFAFARAPEAYAKLADRSAIGILLEYAGDAESGELGAGSGERKAFNRTVLLPSAQQTDGCRLGVIGAGNFALRTLLPAMAVLKNPPQVAVVVSNQGASAFLAAQKFGALRASTDVRSIYEDKSIEAVFITTRHDDHANQTLAALKAGKHVWVEKPLCLTLEELAAIESLSSQLSTLSSSGADSPRLMVGFNRRYAPLAVSLRDALRMHGGPCSIEITVNAGRLEPDHWALDRRVGGGRIVGEGCHFVDLARFLGGAQIVAGACARRDVDGQDGGKFELSFTDGSQAVIDYRTDLPAHWPKETIRVTGDGFEATLLNWKELWVRGLKDLGSRKACWGAPKKGHAEALQAFFAAIAAGTDPQPIGELVEVSRWAIELQRMRTGKIVKAETLKVETLPK